MNKSTAIFGSALIIFGLFFLLRSLDLIWFSFGEMLSVLFPLALIAFGIWMIGRRKGGIQVNISHHYSPPPPTSSSPPAQSVALDPSKLAQTQAEQSGFPTPPPHASIKEEAANESTASKAGGKIRFSKMLGDMFVDCEGYNLSNIEISTGVGDGEIKVSGGILSPGLNRMIVSGFIGDIRIFVPKDFAFFAHSSNFVGEIDIGTKRASGFGNTVEHHSQNYDQAQSKLYIAANSFIGNIKIFQV